MAAILLTDPFPQPLSYHEFADHNLFLGLVHAGDVLSNLAFIFVGGLGLWYLSASSKCFSSFMDSRERWAYWCLFLGVFLTGFGSSWYHLDPDNYSLVWDRLPMSLGFMAVFSAVIAERVKISFGVTLLAPLIVLGLASVLWWIWTEDRGHGDLRWYLLVQFYPMLTMSLMLLLLPTPYTHGSHYWGLLVCYMVAKVTEIFDHQIFEFTHEVISGHSLKHLLAAGGVAWILRMLWLRRPLQR
ncbi:MAG: alkaline phytoceramidase [Candidatus Sedimenticola endophacoides]